MENQEEYYDEVETEDEQQPASPPVAINMEIPEGIPENPESPSPVPSSPAGSPEPAVPAGPEDYDSGEESFGGGDLQVFSAAGINRLQGWAHGVREFRGQPGFIFPVPPIAERFATFLHALYGPRWEELVLCPAGETVFEELRAMLIGFHSQTMFQRAQFLRLMGAWTAQEFRSQRKKLAAAGGFWEVE